MVQVPLRGLFLLGRAAGLIVAAAAVPILLKRCKPLADKVGEEMMKAGQKLRDSAKEDGGPKPQGATVQAAAAPKPAAKPKPKPKATPKAKQRPTRAKPKPAAKKASKPKAAPSRTAKPATA